MIWRGDTGQIWALANNGLAFNFPTIAYSNLPDNPIFGTPPSRLRPIFGFGKVWGNYPTVRSDLGWPILQEVGFNMPVRVSGGTTYLTQLDQSIIQINPDLTWTRLETPPGTPPAILGFNATPDPVVRGEHVTLSWRIQGTELALIEVYDKTDRQNVLQVIQDLPLIGTTTVRIPDDVIGGVRFVLWGVNRSRHRVLVTMWEHVVQSELSVSIWQSPDTDIRTQAAFQQYENGFMLWRADTGAVIVFGGQTGGQVITFAENTYANWPDLPADFDIPPSQVRPVNAFGKVWGHIQAVRDMVGFATGQEQGYQAVIRASSITLTDVSLPDGRTAIINSARFWHF
jgi:hypothetical protein